MRIINFNTTVRKVYIYREYYTLAPGYEYFFQVVKTIFYERAQCVSKMSTRENNIHILKLPCNVLFII